MQFRCTFALWLFLFCLISPLAVTQVYTVTDLGPLVPTAINTWGQVAGNRNGHAFIWTKASGMRDLGTLAGGTFSRAVAINDLGLVAGVADGPGKVVSHNPDYPTIACNNLTQPFLWTRRRGMRGLGAIALYGEISFYFAWCDLFYYATDINMYGQVVGSNQDIDSYKWGFLWTRSDGMTLFADAYQTAANGINNVGQVVGRTGEFELYHTSHAALWEKALRTDLGTLDGADPSWYYCSGANSVNDLAEVVGWSARSSVGSCVSLEAVRAFIWKTGVGMQDLGALPGDASSVALKVNYFGQVIGSSGNSVVWDSQDYSFEVIGRPFIWSQRTGMRDLNALISTNSGWVLNTATGINIWGQIVGSGTRNGKPHGFLLTPKSPFQF